MTDKELSAALDHFKVHTKDHLQDLKDLIRIPSISFPGFDAAPVRTCAAKRCGTAQETRVQRCPSARDEFRLPFRVRPVAERAGGNPPCSSMPTTTSSRRPGGNFGNPALRADGARGTALRPGSSDDKGGAMMHVAAFSSWLRGAGRLPINVKVLIEGEEEVGSSNLEKLLISHHKLLAAEAVVIADSENFDTGVPSLTASLRGIVTVTVEVRSFRRAFTRAPGAAPCPILSWPLPGCSQRLLMIKVFLRSRACWTT